MKRKVSFSTNISQARSFRLPEFPHLNNDGVVVDGKHASETISGVTRRKPEGWVKPTDYSFVRTRYDRAIGTSTRKVYNASQPTKVAETRVHSGCIGGVGGSHNSLNNFNDAFLFGSLSASLRDQALIKARVAMKGTDINLGVAFAERNRTAQLVGDNATRIAKSLRYLKRGDWKAAANQLGLRDAKKPKGSSVTSRWLEYQYGWKPLLSDVYGGAEALAKRSVYDWMVTGKGSSKSPIKIVDKVVGSGQGRARMSVSGLEGCFVRIDAVPQNDLLQSFVSLGCTNPFLVAWELVPFSFVFDWFLPIGSFLDSLDAMLGYGDTFCSVSQLQRASWKGRGEGITAGTNPRIVDVNDFEESKHYVRLLRTASEQVPFPRFPRLKDPRSLTRMANGLSLLAQVVQGRR